MKNISTSLIIFIFISVILQDTQGQLPGRKKIAELRIKRISEISVRDTSTRVRTFDFDRLGNLVLEAGLNMFDQPYVNRYLYKDTLLQEMIFTNYSGKDGEYSDTTLYFYDQKRKIKQEHRKDYSWGEKLIEYKDRQAVEYSAFNGKMEDSPDRYVKKKVPTKGLAGKTFYMVGYKQTYSSDLSQTTKEFRLCDTDTLHQFCLKYVAGTFINTDTLTIRFRSWLGDNSTSELLEIVTERKRNGLVEEKRTVSNLGQIEIMTEVFKYSNNKTIAEREVKVQWENKMPKMTGGGTTRYTYAYEYY